MERYKILGHPMSKEVASTGPNCQEILKQAGVNDAKIGKTKVFMKHNHGALLDEKLLPFASAAKLIGKFGVGFLERARCKTIIESKRMQDTVVKAWLDTIPKLGSPFATSAAAGKTEDGAAMLAAWKEREKSGRAAPAAAAKAAKDADAESKKNHDAASAKSASGAPPTRGQVIEFYKEMGDEQGAGQTEDGRFCAWFHGMLSRKRSEELLQNEQDGTFLIRLAESRFGCVLLRACLLTVEGW